MLLILFLILILLLTNGESIKWYVRHLFYAGENDIRSGANDIRSDFDQRDYSTRGSMPPNVRMRTGRRSSIDDRIKRINYDMVVANRLMKTRQHSTNPNIINKQLAQLQLELKTLEASRRSGKNKWLDDTNHPSNTACHCGADHTGRAVRHRSKPGSGPRSHARYSDHDMESGFDHAGNSIDNAYHSGMNDVESGFDHAGHSMEKDYRSGMNDVESGFDHAGRSMEKDYRSGVNDVESGVDHAGRSIDSGVNDVESGVDHAGRSIDSAYHSGVNDVESGFDDIKNALGGASEIVTDAYHYGNMVNRKVDRWGNDLRDML